MRIEQTTNRFYLGRDYSEAVEAAGGIPVHISLIPSIDYIDSVVAQLDGILTRLLEQLDPHGHMSPRFPLVTEDITKPEEMS